MRVQRVALEDHRDLPRPRRQPVDDVAADQHLAVGRLLQPRDRAQQRRLAAARGPEQDEVLPFGRRQIDAVDGADVAAAEVLAEPSDLDRERHLAVAPARHRTDHYAPPIRPFLRHFSKIGLICPSARATAAWGLERPRAARAYMFGMMNVPKISPIAGVRVAAVADVRRPVQCVLQDGQLVAGLGAERIVVEPVARASARASRTPGRSYSSLSHVARAKFSV